MKLYKPFARLRNDDAGDDAGGGFADNGDAIGTGNDARIALLNSIGDANDTARAEELLEINDDGSTSRFAVDETTQQELDRAEQEANQAPEGENNSAPELPSTEKRFKIKVNGRELELTEEELIARAQKVESADQYIAEAARLKREWEAQPQIPQPPVTPTGPTEAELLEERRALVRAIQMGTEEEAMHALEKLQQPARPALNAEDLARTVDERLTFKEAVQRFERDYQDILGDPVLRDLALQADQRLLAQGDKRSYWERYEAIGNDLRNWKESITPKAPPPAAPTPTQTLESKAARKASAPAAPKPASARAPAAPRDDEGDESVSDVISAIAKARGGPQWLRS